MTHVTRGWRALLFPPLLIIVAVVAACSHRPVSTLPTAADRPETSRTQRKPDLDIADLHRIPQDLTDLAAAAEDRLKVAGRCQERPDDFRHRYFAPWTFPEPSLDRAETLQAMRQAGQAAWYGVNRRRVPARTMRELLENCALENFPSRNETAISVAPGHLRGLPTYLPLYDSPDGQPFDMLSYPQVKLNEPLRVLHASRDGIWLYVENGYSAGWLEKRNLALVDSRFIDAWMPAPQLVVVRDGTPLPDGAGVGVYPAKIGTILPRVAEEDEAWEAMVASAGEGGQARTRQIRIPKRAAAPFPLALDPANLGLVGNQMLGQPYGWGEIYGLRDCSALLRDFFLPFGVWLPRTSSDQIASLPQRIDLSGMSPAQKEATLRSHATPFLSLLYKPGHIMLYVGQDAEGRPLVFHDAWSVHLEGSGPGSDPGRKAEPEAAAEQGAGASPGAAEQRTHTRIIGMAAVTTLQPGEELGLVPGSSLLERVTELGNLTGTCADPAPLAPRQR